ncbi:uncharacterized protein E0L32_008638 [Thyridium curvatum]|uniref:Maleylacetoacetate isomerase n=1 Tax=Thyridium curvatum TaxID=1093900 RepID=A0A507AZI2_9PEZI|nr:uncharacterized protein E0L32_008638 [Thyridium curvatum]TPX10419.1 hypothetical protein E0L32_008638 [Thyridium curvatum]
MASKDNASSLTLYSWSKSSCSCRLRIALSHKKLPYRLVDIDYASREHHRADYARMNPSRSVPTLVVTSSGGGEADAVHIGQSVAALEFLEEAFPDAPALLPAARDLAARALVRTLVQAVVTDMQPPTNTRVLDMAREMGVADVDEWCRRVHVRGFTAYEGLIAGRAGKFSLGDEVTLADVCLVPAAWNATGRWGMELSEWPTVMRVFNNLMELEAFKGEDWRGKTA